jgi:hypothetical protein
MKPRLAALIPTTFLLTTFLALPSSIAAQSAMPADARLSIGAVGTIAVERFSADRTFDAIFGQPVGALLGGGVRVTHRRMFFEVTASRFSRTGERGFSDEGEGFGLDIPLTVVIRPVEFSAGYRFTSARPSITPYLGGGLGIYRYAEMSPSADPGEEVTMSHAGWLLVGGAEFRLHRWVALAADIQYTNVPGILGQGGLSQEVDEPNLGGVAARFKIIFGR